MKDDQGAKQGGTGVGLQFGLHLVWFMLCLSFEARGGAQVTLWGRLVWVLKEDGRGAGT